MMMVHLFDSRNVGNVVLRDVDGSVKNITGTGCGVFNSIGCRGGCGDLDG